MRKISVKPKHVTTKIDPAFDDIKFDDERRLRNALKALAQMDPAWESWLADRVPANAPISERRKLVEHQARTLTARRYSFLGNSLVQQIIDSDLYFTDTGSLKAHL